MISKDEEDRMLNLVELTRRYLKETETKLPGEGWRSDTAFVMKHRVLDLGTEQCTVQGSNSLWMCTRLHMVKVDMWRYAVCNSAANFPEPLGLLITSTPLFIP